MSGYPFKDGDYVDANNINELIAQRDASTNVAGNVTKSRGGSYVPGPAWFIGQITSETGTAGVYNVKALTKTNYGGALTLEDDGRTVEADEINAITGITSGTRVIVHRWDNGCTFEGVAPA